MPLTFLVPAVLAGLGALVVPLLLHLRRRERQRPTRFPSLMFLKRVPFKTARRRRITDWPLLLLRAVIVSLAIFAFARPVLRSSTPRATDRPARRTVLLLDRSLSMSYQGTWQRAVDSGVALIRGLRADDRVAVIAFDDEASVLQKLTLDHAAALAALRRASPGSGGTRFGAALRAARETLLSEAGLGGDIVMISDLQRTGSGGAAGLALPALVTFRAIAVAPAMRGNAAVVGLDVKKVPGADRGMLAIAARVGLFGISPARSSKLQLRLNGRVSGSKQLTLPAHGVAAVAFDPVPMPISEVRVEVAMDPDSLGGDDTFNAVIPAAITRRILLVADDRAETLYLERALATGGNPGFQVERVAAAQVDAQRLRDAAAVVLLDALPPAGARGTALASWIHAGGGLVIAGATALSNHTLPPDWAPVRLGATVDRRGDGGGRFGDVVYEHPIFTAFRASGNAALAAPHFFRYTRTTAQADAAVLARFDDGTPAVVDRAYGSGHAVYIGTPLQTADGDFPLQAAYLPFVRRIAIYASGADASPMWFSTGEAWSPPKLVPDPVLRAPSGDLLRPAGDTAAGALMFAESGIYTVYQGRAAGQPVQQIAVNPPSDESDLTAMLPSELLLGVAQDTASTRSVAAASLAETEGRQRVWRTLLIVVATLLLLEAFISALGWRGTAAAVVTSSEGGTA